VTKFSVVVPTKDRPALLSRSVASVLAQAQSDVEIIVVNDGEGQVGVFDDGRIKLVNSHRRGVAAARNAGIANATGEFVAFLDDDDLYCAGRLDVPPVDVSVCKRLQNGRETFYGWWPQPSAHVGQVTIRRGLCPPFDERFTRTEDVDWWLSILERSEPLALPFVGYVLRDVADDRLTRASEADIAFCVRLLLSKHPRWFAEHREAAAFNWMRAGLAASSVSYLWRSCRLSPSKRNLTAFVRQVIGHGWSNTVPEELRDFDAKPQYDGRLWTR
jgi:glycosyltransferase involved in cell wall biosynthesis